MTRDATVFGLRRLAAALVLVFSVSIAAFVLARLAPGDETTPDIQAGVDERTIAQKRERLGLDRPFAVQLAEYCWGVLRLDLGRSAAFEQPVGALVLERGANTARLGFAALLFATLIGLPLGIVTGSDPGGWTARIVSVCSSIALACPPLVAVLALLFLAISTDWISTSPDRLLIPALALGLPIAAMLERLQSQAMRDAMASPDLQAAAARGIPPARLIWVHAARQSLRPVLGVYGIVIGSVFSGSLAVEFATSWPGLGRLMYEGVRAGDVKLVAGCVFAGGVCLAVGNLVADGLRAWADPRVRGIA
ncbi:MAG TPA: ABC transporter permease [Vicinamibacterales bacterium]|nr:ABC transporter permease [Vicinamibacterales bacterium]